MKWTPLILFILFLASCGPSAYVINRGNDKIEARAHLVDAYSTFDRCGSKGRYSCEVFKGRYYLPDHQIVVDRDINGFVYKDFKEAGNIAPMGTEMFYRSTLEGRESGWWFVLAGFGAFCGMLTFFYPIAKSLE